MTTQRWALPIAGLGLALAFSAAWAQKSYGPGVTDTEIKLGQTMPYSGPASSLGAQGLTDGAYFARLNEQGGINGRRVKLLSLDDGYSPPKTVEQTRKLIEQEQVLAIYHSLGTPTNSATYRYVNAQKVPQLFIVTGAEKFRDAAQAPWTVPIVPALTSEARALARYILGSAPQARIAVLYQNDDLGHDMLKGFKQGLGANAGKMIVAEASYEVTDPTIDSQIVSLKSAGADTLMLFAVPRFSAQALKKVAAIGWKPLRFVAAPSANATSVMKPVGPEIASRRDGGEVSQGPERSGLGQRSGDAGIPGLHEALPSRRRPDGLGERLRVHQRTAHGPHPGAVRRRAHARESHAARARHQGPGAALAAARHQDEHQPDASSADRPVPDRAVRRAALGGGGRGGRRLIAVVWRPGEASPCPEGAAWHETG